MVYGNCKFISNGSELRSFLNSKPKSMIFMLVYMIAIIEIDNVLPSPHAPQSMKTHKETGTRKIMLN